MHTSVRFAATALLAAVLLAQNQTNIEGRVEALLVRMTLDEKIGQMSQSTAMATPITEGIKAEIRAWTARSPQPWCAAFRAPR